MTADNSEEVRVTQSTNDNHIADSTHQGSAENTVGLPEKLVAESQPEQFTDLNLNFNLTTQPQPGDKFLPSMAIWQSSDQIDHPQDNQGQLALENNQPLPARAEDFGWTARYAANFYRADQEQHIDLGSILGLPQGAPKELLFEKAHEQEDDLLKQLMA